MRAFIYLQFHLALLLFTFGGAVEGACSGVELIGRDAWGAKMPKDVASMKVPVPYVFIHHTAMGECYTQHTCIRQIKEVQDLHMDKNGWSDIGYNFLVGEDGRVYEARGWNRTGAHTKYYNHVAVAVSVMGNFMTRIPNKKALDAVHAIINCGVKEGFIDPKYELFGHRDVRKTECPGDAFYEHIKQWSHFSFNKPNLHPDASRGLASKYFASLKVVVIGFLVATITILVNY